MSAISSAPSSIPTPFDVLHQAFVLHDREGTAFVSTMEDLTVYAQQGISTASVYALQCGAAAAVFIMLLILTKPEKRSSPVFILNACAILFSIIASALECEYWTGPWYSPYAYLSSDFSLVPTSAVAESIAVSLFVFLVQLCLEASLVLQVHVVCVTLDRLQRLAIMVVSVTIATVAVVLRLVQMIYADKYNDILRQENHSLAGISKATNISLAISICFFSTIFIAKLGWFMYQRRRLGLQSFGPMQVILIGGTQTMIIPVVFVILQFAVPTSKASSLIMSITAISLPMTSIWASASASNALHAQSQTPVLALAPNAPSAQNNFGSGNMSFGSNHGHNTRNLYAESGFADENSGYWEKGDKDVELQPLGRA